MQILVVFVLMFVLTYYYSKSNSCANNTEIWCKDDWYCKKQTASTDTVYNRCFKKKDNLASCPDSDAAVKCIDLTKKKVACECAIPKGTDSIKGNNCLSGCPSSLKKAGCDPTSQGCPYDEVPPECLPK